MTDKPDVKENSNSNKENTNLEEPDIINKIIKKLTELYLSVSDSFLKVGQYMKQYQEIQEAKKKLNNDNKKIIPISNDSYSDENKKLKKKNESNINQILQKLSNEYDKKLLNKKTNRNMKTPLKNVDTNIFKDMKLDENNSHCKSEQKKEYLDSNQKIGRVINLNEEEKV